MHLLVSLIAGLVLLPAGAVQAPAQFSIRAASWEPVDGWQMMQVAHCQTRCMVWVSPTPTLTAADIERAQPQLRADGYRVINAVFTDAGANKMHDLTAAQLKKVVAMVLDDKVIWTPLVTSVTPVTGSFPTAKNNVLTGSTSQGLTEDEVERLMTILPH